VDVFKLITWSFILMLPLLLLLRRDRAHGTSFATTPVEARPQNERS
jgi:hypothetical protein